MKKIILFMFSVLIIASSVAAFSTVSLAAPVKQPYLVTKETRKDNESNVYTENYTYNSNGYLTKEASYYSTTTYSYDSKGNVIKYSTDGNTTNYTYNSSGNVTKEESDDGIINYTYNNNGELSKKVCKYLWGTTTKTYTRNSNGYITKMVYTISYADGKKLTETTTYSYDSKGNITKEVSEEGKNKSTKTNTYNSGGKLIKEVVNFNYNGSSSTFTTTYAYNSSGNLTKWSQVSNESGEKYTDTITYSYNSKGKLSKEVYTSDRGGYFSKDTTTYTYDTNGKLTKEITNSERAVSTTIYSYDSNGNLTRKTTTEKYAHGEVRTYSTEYSYTKAKLGVYSDDDTNLTYIFKDTFKYTGKAITPVVSIEQAIDGGSTILARGVDYELIYSNNTKVGTGKIKVHFINECSDLEDVTFSFKITSNPVTGLKQTSVSQTAVKLAWDKFSGAKYYKVEQSTDGKTWTVVNSATTENTITVSKLKAGTKYQFRVTALDSSKKKIGNTSAVFQIQTLYYSPTVSLKTAKVNALTLSWTKIPGAKYHKVEQSTDGKTWTVVSSATTSTSITVSKLKAGTKYQFRVTALDSSKKKIGKTSSVLKTQTLCSAPAITVTSTKSKTATANWKKITGASKYILYKSTDNENWTKVATTTALTYNVTNLTSGKKIYIKVTAVNAYDKKSEYSSVKSVTVKK